MVSSPFVDATLPDGSRLHVVIPDITRVHWNVNIRQFVVKADHLEVRVRLGTLTRSAARFLDASVVAGLNILGAGGTQSGKTTMLNCLSPQPCLEGGEGRAETSTPTDPREDLTPDLIHDARAEASGSMSWRDARP